MKIKDQSVRETFDKANKNKRITNAEMWQIIMSAMDYKGVTKKERDDLQQLRDLTREHGGTRLDKSARKTLNKFLRYCQWLSGRPWSYSVLSGQYLSGNIAPSGWYGSAYDTGGNGACAVKVSLAVKKTGYSKFGDFGGKFQWPNAADPEGLPVNAKELATYLEKKLGKPRRFYKKSRWFKLRQGIVYMTGFQNASGHITLWDGKKFADGTNYSVSNDPKNTKFWDLRPDWIKWAKTT